MPFGLKLGGRKKRYNVLNKNSFVVRIQLLNNNETELTLSVESTGSDCLEAVSGRLEIHETRYFGLWFLGKAQQPRWVDLEKSLKKQLDKFASESLLYFGVMHFVPCLAPQMQPATRFQYYLQLKKYVLDGHLLYTAEQYIRLAGLAVQIEYRDYERFENHDFREYMLFPVGWPQDEAFLGDIINKIALEHKALSGMPPKEAEILYIKEAEHLEGYGQECFRVKDNHGNDITLCVFYMGIFVRNGQSAVSSYRWNDIGHITHNKSAVVLDLIRKDETVLFHMEDIESSKYMSRLLSSMHKFYKEVKICTEQSNSPPVVRRQPTWKRSSMSRTPTNKLPIRHVQGSETYMSEDNIFHINEDGFNYRSQTSLDAYPMEINFMNGTVPNGSVSSAHSMNSLNRSQNFVPVSPMSSNLSITGSDIMRVDHIPTYRHSAIIVPSYRPTPDYDTVMRQMNRGVLPKDSQSQSLRNLNIGNTHAYRHRETLVYSQPEIHERPRYVTTYGPQPTYSNKPVNQSEQIMPCSTVTNQTNNKAISHTVSTPELANVPPPGNKSLNAVHMVRHFLSRPPPPYPPPRPASSTPDLASHRHKYVSSSSPDLVTRKVQQSVKTFQEDSSPVVHQSLQEVSEPLIMGKHHPINKRHSFEVITSMVRGMEAMALKTLNAPLPRRNTLREQVYTEESLQKNHDVQQLPMYHHKKTCSDATMLIHSSESEEEEESHKSVQYTSSMPGIAYSAQLQAALARIPNKPPPEYPGPRKSISNGALRHDPASISAAIARAKAMTARPTQTASISRTEQTAINGTSLGPSISEPDLTSVKERVKKEPVKERPVSEMFSIEDVIVEREIMMRNLKKQEMAALEAQKRPLMLAALNGLSVSRIPVPEDRQDDTTVVQMDERCRTLRRKLEEGMVFTEYEQIPKRKTDGVFTTATLPENYERNRVHEVIPYEENRVTLVPTKENPTGYINASHLKAAVAGKEWHYIATQAPLPQTFHDFWQMVWEQGVNVISMVTGDEEEGKAKSHRYWPKLGSRHSATYGKFKVTTNFRTDSGCYATTGLKVKHLLSDQERTVWHLQFMDWPSHGCPEEVQGFLSYLEEIQSVRRHANSMMDTSNLCNPPVVVHCSAGVGRTGVVVLTELMIRCLEHDEKIEIPIMLKRLREQRMFMIQTIAQYKFVYQVLIQFLERSRLI
ncbi:tyrosine-protein phosphatase non-receptor type 14 [Bombina bombina]|uniref:tyrosine-protein phosphatase non-receptor type 14 n=1 Tax=Bombina bombina TaxID=8345 RepID=UPI00235ACAF5|nr:tyrosine-protein phosphatase non-receptor type 14 [Bombina bombina]XP_053568467.1 tyrosine-protein phosphatase non-receptor type 14 [Bombina bombina]